MRDEMNRHSQTSRDAGQVEEALWTRLIVMTAAAAMPSSCFGKSRYRRVALVRVDDEVLRSAGLARPKMISKHAVGVVQIVRTWERLYVGSTPRSAYNRALSEAVKMAADMSLD